MSKDKVRIKDLFWSVGTIYDTRELPGVSITGPGVDGVLQVVSEPTLAVSRAVWLGVQVYGVCGPGVVTHGMAYDDTRHTNVAKRGDSWIRVDRRGRQTSKGGCRCFGSDRAPGVAHQGAFWSRTMLLTVAQWFALNARETVDSCVQFRAALRCVTPYVLV
jgi:hypothetical protein